jgi:methyl-accepting chemotaxis protein
MSEPSVRAARRGAGIGRWLADRPMAVKFLLVIGVTAAVAIAVGVTATKGMAAIRSDAEHMYSDDLGPLSLLDKMRDGALNMRIDVLNAGVSVDSATAEKFLSKIPADDATFDQALTTYSARQSAQGNQHVADLRQGMDEYRKIRDTKLIPAVRNHDPIAFGHARDAEGAPAFAKINVALADLGVGEDSDAKASLDRAAGTASTQRTTLLTVLVIGLLLALALGLVQSRLVARAVHKVGALADALGRGDLTRTSDVDSRDEIGRMAAALDGATARLRQSVGVVATSSQSLAAAAEELSAASQQIATSADETTAQAGTVSGAAEEVSRSVQTVAAGTEEMSASIREIANNASDAAHVAGEAVGIVESVNATVGQLGASSQEIGNVVSLITSIAEQTNLLALNATIEAARAGDAGKGFAVVASEVKDLAQETAKATGDISTRVQTIQSDAEAAVEAIGRIVEVIEKINGYSTMIASAVEEQTATTSEISRNITEAASGSSQIAENITGVASAADQTTEGVNESRRTADEVARMAGDLQRVVAQFQV